MITATQAREQLIQATELKYAFISKTIMEAIDELKTSTTIHTSTDTLAIVNLLKFRGFQTTLERNPDGSYDIEVKW